MDKLSTNYNINDTYSIRGVDFVVASRRYVSRGRSAGGYEIMFAPLGKLRGTKYAMRATVKLGQVFPGVQAASKAYDQATLDAAIAEALGTKQAVAEHRTDLVEAGRDVLRPTDAAKLNIEEGDIVTIQYANGPKRDEKCVGVNLGTGKVAIEVRGAASGKRWLFATQVVASKRGHRALPFALTEAEAAQLEAQGWVQARRGSEFIERSCVVAKSEADARAKGQTYDTPDRKVYQTHTSGSEGVPATTLYWRDTGCFD